MIDDALLGNPDEETTTIRAERCWIVFAVFAFFTFLQRNSSPLQVQETPVGVVSEGEYVYLTELVDNIPANTKGVVTNIDVHGNCLVQIFVDEGSSVNHFVAHFSKLAPIPLEPVMPYPMVTPRSHFAPEVWPYWELIRQDPWYTTHICPGQADCNENQHPCDESELTFERISAHLGQKTYVSKFEYQAGVTVEFQQLCLKSFIMALMRKKGSRLYFIDIYYSHSFIIEQKENEFRIYQSWTDGFDLQYWTRPEISMWKICEPGKDYAQRLMDPMQRNYLLSIGVENNVVEISIARSRFGNLQSVNGDEIVGLFEALGFGFSMERYREQTGSIPPLPNRHSTKRWLGKSAIDRTVTPFTMEIRWIEFQPEQT